jgi:glutathione peroxidase
MINRRILIASALSALASPLPGRKACAQGAMTKMTAYAFSFPALAGGEIRLSDYAGHPMLVVNTASLCGFTPQYAGLQQLCHHYGVTFPMAAKTIVSGANAHPFYKWAAVARPSDVPRWNFRKFLIGRDGYIAEVFAESVEPLDTRVKTAIARALAAS